MSFILDRIILSKNVLITLSILEFFIICVLSGKIIIDMQSEIKTKEMFQLPIEQENSEAITQFSGKKSTGALDKCAQNNTTYTVNGDSMNPLLVNGTRVTVQEGYYDCGGHIARGDIVIYNSDSTKINIIKQVRALPGDSLALDEKNGTLSINNEIMKNSKGDMYHFSDKEQKFLNIYFNGLTKQKTISRGKLQEGAYFIFGDNINNSLDSRGIGAVGKNGFVGKVISKLP